MGLCFCKKGNEKRRQNQAVPITSKLNKSSSTEISLTRRASCLPPFSPFFNPPPFSFFRFPSFLKNCVSPFSVVFRTISATKKAVALALNVSWLWLFQFLQIFYGLFYNVLPAKRLIGGHQ